MAQENQDGGLIRRYLLGRLQENELEQLEERMMVDNGLYEQVLLAEDEMIEAYVNGELPESDVADFRASFMSTPEGRQQVKYAEALREHVDAISISPAVDDLGGSEDPGSRQLVVEAPLEKEKLAEKPVAEEPFLENNVVHPPVWWRRPELNTYLKLAAAAVIVIGLGLGIWQVISPSEVSKGSKTLAYAYRDQRPIEARISGFGYAPVSTTRGGEPRVDKTARTLAENILLDAVMKHPNAATHHAAGRLYLAEKKFDEAIEQFEEALKGDPNNAQLHSDYGAVLLEKGKADRLAEESGKSLEEFGRSLEHLSRAIEIDGSLLEPIFNRALCRQYLMLNTEAEDDWRKYLEKDSISNWAGEARQNLNQLLERRRQRSQGDDGLLDEFLGAYRQRDDARAWAIVSRNREPATGRSVFHELVDSYLGSLLAQSESKSKAQAINYLARLEVERSSDRYFSDLAKFYGSASIGQLKVVFRAQELMRTAYDQYVLSRFDEAFASYGKARDLFIQAGDQLDAGYAECCVGRCYAETARVQNSLTILKALARKCEGRKHYWLLAQALNAIGSAHAVLNEYSAAIENTSAALEVSERIQDSYGEQKNLAQLAVEYKNIGNYDRALSFLDRSLILATQSESSSRQMWRTYDTSARVFTSMNHYVAAVDYEREALQIASEGKDLSLTYVSLVHLGLVYGKLQNYAEAIKNAETGFEIAQSLSSGPARLDMMAYSSLQLGDLNREASILDSAVTHYDRAIQLDTELDSAVDLYEAHKGKLLCYIAQKSYPLAEEEIATTLSLFEEHRSKIEEESNRNAFADDQQSIYDVAIDFEYSMMNNSEAAFQHSENSRARSLLALAGETRRLTEHDGVYDLIPGPNPKPLNLAQIQERLPDEVQVVEYTSLNDKVLIWVFTKTSFDVAEQRINSDELKGRVLSFLKLVARPAEGTKEELLSKATDLYRLLITPVQPMLNDKKLLCVVPDKILNYVPFCALVSPKSGEYLVSDHVLLRCPSTNIFLACSDGARKKEGRKTERILSVGNPKFDARAFPSLAVLTSSAREAETVASYYSSRCCLIEGDASEGRVKNEMGKSDVVHLASHYVMDERSPMLSKLILAKEIGQAANNKEADGVLQAHEIYGLDLQQTRLVVLSACTTGVEKYYDGEGMMGMSRAFIAAGVPLIVASLWEVDSDASTELMISFHRYRTQGGLSTVEALKQAQLEMATGSEPRYQHPYYWASFMAIGGHASF